MSTQNSAHKPHQQFTRKKIEQYSYGLSDVIGKGYSSHVYKGRHDNSQQAVAVKVIDMKMLKNEINRTLLESEIQILKELKNLPYVLKFHEVYTTKNNTYIITELCSSDLTKRIKEKMTEEQAFYYMDQVIQGYLQIYEKEIVHRDLKPANILITQKDQCKIADFGFAIKNQELSKPSKYNVGSPLYMAPQSLKKNEYSYKTDLWSVGVIFFELLTGQTPWKAKTEKDLLKKVETQRIQNLIERRKLKFDAKTVQFLTRCLCIQKHKRLEPYELKKYRFSKSQSQQNILTEVKVNIMPLYESGKKSTNQNIISPKSQYDTKFNLNNASANFKSMKNPLQNATSFNQTMRITTFTNNTATKDENGNNKNELKRNNIKMISKQLISEIHFCRYLFKLLNKIKQSSQKEGILSQFSQECLQLEKRYTMFIKHKIERLISFSNENFLELDENVYLEYKDSSDFKKILKISKQYKDRYKTQLSQNWNFYFDKKFTTSESLELVKKILSAFLTKNDVVETDIGKYEKDIVILDYLITAKQLLEMMVDGENYEKFSRKSKIEEIVEGTTASITVDLYQKIVQRARQITLCN